MSTDSMEFPVFEMPDAPPELEELPDLQGDAPFTVSFGALIPGSVSPVNLRGSVVRVV
jgi:hypothetical protein